MQGTQVENLYCPPKIANEIKCLVETLVAFFVTSMDLSALCATRTLSPTTSCWS